MIKDPAARRRASFAIADRRRKEAAKTTPRTAERQPKAKPQARKATPQRKATEPKKAPARKAGDRKEVERKAGERRLAHTAKIAEQRRADADRRARQRRDAQRKEQLQKEFNRKAEDRKATERRAVEQKKARDAELLEKAARQYQPRAAAHVAEGQRRQQADQITEHRRQTGTVRNRHHEEIRSMRQNEADAIDRHWHACKRIDAAEGRAIDDLDRKWNGLPGRVRGLVRGSKAYDRERQGIADRHEAERMKQHRDLEALKERQFEAIQKVRLRQAHERKDIFERHFTERQELTRAQEAARPRMIEAREQAMVKALATEKSRELEHAWEQARGGRP